VAGKYLHKDQLAVLVVGNPKDFDKPLAALGPVTNLDITIPPPPGETNAQGAPAAAPSAPAVSNAEGKALAAKVAEALGGTAKLKSIHAIRAKMEQSSAGEASPPVEVTVVFPDRMHVAMESPMGPMNLVFTATSAFMAAQGQVRDIPASQKKESLDQIKRDITFIAQHADDPKFTFTANGSEKIGDVEAKILDINADGTPTRWYIDPKNGRVLRERFTAMGRSGPFQSENDFSEWKSFDGLMLPAKQVSKQDGTETGTVTFTEIHVNPQVDSKLFDKPASSNGQ
jgi:hypothetical protein